MKQLKHGALVRTGVRLPPELLAWLTTTAHQRGESMNRIVVTLLETARKSSPK